MGARVAGLLTLSVAFMSLFVFVAAPAARANSDTCTDAVRLTSGCPVDVQSDIRDQYLDLSYRSEAERPSLDLRTTQPRSESSTPDARVPDPLTIEDLGYLPNCPDMAFDRTACLRGPVDAPPPQDTPGPAPTVTLNDLASFSPRADRLSAEPGDWAIAGLAVNPVADDAPAAASGELLGLPAEVRFTPVEFLWDHGDGSTLSTPDGGATWTDLGQAEFSETATSHVYEQPGTYTLSLAVRFAAEYSVGGGPWTPVAGTLLADSGAFEITVGSAGTVLIDRDCRTGVRGPGC